MAQQSINIGSTANDGTGDPLRTAFDKANDNFDELYALAGTESLVHISSIDGTPIFDVSDNVRIQATGGVREVLRQAIWIGTTYPTSGVTSTSTGVSNPVTIVTLANLSSVDSHLIEMSNNAGTSNFKSSTVYQFNPTASNSRMALVFLGHGTAPDTGVESVNVDTGQAEWLRDLLAAGFTCFLVPMPDNGYTASHDSYPDPTATLNYLKFFCEPAIRILNDFADDYVDVVACGHSGGGGECVRIAAIDERIKYTYANAGSMPEFAARLITTGRDWEQRLPGVYTPGDTLDASATATAGQVIANGTVVWAGTGTERKLYKNASGGNLTVPGTIDETNMRAAGFIKVFPGIDWHDLYVMCCSGGRKLNITLVAQDGTGLNYLSFASGWDWRQHAVTIAEGMNGKLVFDLYGLLNTHYVHERTRQKTLEFFEAYKAPKGPIIDQWILPTTAVDTPPLSGVLADATSNGNDAQLLALCPTFSGSQFYFLESASLPDLTGDFTVILGLKWTQRVSIHTPLAVKNGAGNTGQLLVVACDVSGTGTIKAFVGDATCESGTGFGDASDHLVIVTRSGTTVDMFVDANTSVGSSTQTVTLVTSTPRIHIGCNFASPASPAAIQQFHGNAYSLIIFERALSSDERAAFFTSRTVPTGANKPAAWYPLEEGRNSAEACEVMGGVNIPITGTVWSTLNTQRKICYTNRFGYYRDTNGSGAKLYIPARQDVPTKSVATTSSGTPAIASQSLTMGNGPFHNGGPQKIDFGGGETWTPGTRRSPPGYERYNVDGGYYHDFRRYG